MDKTKILLDDRKKQRGIHRSIPVNTPIILGNMPRGQLPVSLCLRRKLTCGAS